jgi:NTP pyrophosphatase (non-canonical NTP hydrolase)
MDLNEYQKLARRTSAFAPIDTRNNTDRRENMLMATLGLNGEAGEVADHIKKMVYHLDSPNLDKLSDEIGDVLWYVAELCSALGFNLNSVAAQNIEKLQSRYGSAFSTEASINRKEEC